MQTFKTHVCVIGGGSGGIGAAYGAASCGADVILVEKNHILGGTITMSWVHTWEPVCDSSPLCKRLWQRMQTIPLGARETAYEKADRRLNPHTGTRNGALLFEPWAFLMAVDAEFAEIGNIDVFYNSRFIASERENGNIKKIICSGIGGTYAIEANWFIDCTAEINLAREAGCSHRLGTEAKSVYNEPHAPGESDRNNLNQVNWIYRVRPTANPVRIDESPVPEYAQIDSYCAGKLPNGDILINICGQGILPPDQPKEHGRILQEQRQLAWDSYRWQVLVGKHPDWEFLAFAPEIGIREGYRLDARYVVTENDVLAGVTNQIDPGPVAAYCDHPLDIHGTMHQELREKFAIPMASLMPKEYDNLLVASRGAGFSHIAAGTCRLSRTVMTFAHAAGRYTATV